MRAKAIATVLAAAAILAMCLPAGALARPGFYKVPGESSEVVQLRGSGGSRFALQAFDRRASATFDKSVGHGGLQLLTYSLRGRIGAGPDLHFHLGRHGEVDLRFVPGKREVRKTAGCTGGPSVTERGHFVGTIRIRGQHGLGGVDVHRVAGVVSHEPPLICRRLKPRPGVNSVGLSTTSGKPRVPKGALELIAGTPGGPIRFEAFRFETIGLSSFQSFEASAGRREGNVTVSSLGTVSGPGSSFVSLAPNEPLSAATVSPPAPFSGSATFAMTSPNHGEWTGDLAVELPGYGRVPLTGPKIAAGLCETKACTPTLPKALRPRTGPGAKHFKVSYFSE